MTTIRKILPLLALALLTACAVPADAPSFAQTPRATPMEGKAVLYLYRDYAEPTAWRNTISIDGKEVAVLPQKSFTWIHVSVGKHTMSSRWPMLAGMPKVEFPFEPVAGASYFFEVKGTSQLTGTSYAPGGVNMHFFTETRMKVADERAALAQLEKCCRFIPAELAGL